jgi:hypothetical protein
VELLLASRATPCIENEDDREFWLIALFVILMEDNRISILGGVNNCNDDDDSESESSCLLLSKLVSTL